MESEKIKREYKLTAIKPQVSELQNFLNSNKLTDSTIEIATGYVFKAKSEPVKKKHISCTAVLPYKDISLLKTIKEKLPKTLISKNIELKCHLRAGDKFFPIMDTVSLKTNEKSTISHTSSTYLIYFWASWASECKNSLERAVDMLQANKNTWEDKVKLISINLDSDADALTNYMKQTAWHHNFDNYTLEKNWNNPLVQAYDVRILPKLAIIDINGTIAFIGDPRSEKIEALVDNLIRSGEKMDGRDNLSPSYDEGIPLADFKRLRKALHEGALNKYLESDKTHPHENLYCLLQQTKYYNSEFQFLYSSRDKLIIGGSFTKESEKVARVLLDEVLDSLPRNSIHYRFKMIDTLQIGFGNKCDACNKELSREKPQYYSYQENKYFCCACGDEVKDDEAGVAKFVSPHALLFLDFSGDPSKTLEIIKATIKDQKRPQNLYTEKSLSKHSISCNVCGQSINSTRWKCLTCPKTNLCDDCFEQSRSGEEETISKLRKCGHGLSSHILQRFSFCEA